MIREALLELRHIHLISGPQSHCWSTEVSNSLSRNLGQCKISNVGKTQLQDIGKSFTVNKFSFMQTLYIVHCGIIYSNKNMEKMNGYEKCDTHTQTRMCVLAIKFLSGKIKSWQSYVGP